MDMAATGARVVDALRDHVADLREIRASRPAHATPGTEPGSPREGDPALASQCRAGPSVDAPGQRVVARLRRFTSVAWVGVLGIGLLGVGTRVVAGAGTPGRDRGLGPPRRRTALAGGNGSLG